MDTMITNPSKKMVANQSKSRSIFLHSQTPTKTIQKKQTKTIKPMPKEHMRVELKLKPISQNIDIQNPQITQSDIQISLNPVKLDKLSDLVVAPPPSPTPNLRNEKVVIKEPVFENIDSTLAIKKVEPRYPRRAKRRGITGYVKCKFKIDQNGKVYDIKITSSKPKGVFDKSALQALKQWRFNKFTNRQYKTSSAKLNFEVE